VEPDRVRCEGHVDGAVRVGDCAGEAGVRGALVQQLLEVHVANGRVRAEREALGLGEEHTILGNE